jgi:hypothetical protein
MDIKMGKIIMQQFVTLDGLKTRISAFTNVSENTAYYVEAKKLSPQV